MGAVRMGAVRMGAVRRGAVRMGEIPLTEVTLSIPGGWDAILQGTDLEGAPINTLTLADVLPYLADVTLDQIQIAPLDTLPFAAWLLANNPLAHIPLSDQLRAGTDQDRLNAWCDVLKTDTTDPCATLEVDPNASPASPVTLFDVAVNGFSLDGVTLGQVVVRDVASEASAWFTAMPLSGFQIRNTVLAGVPVSSLPSGYVDCTKVNCATANLGQASQVGAINTTKTLLDLFTDPAALTIPEIASFTLADLYQGLFAPEDLPWEDLDLANVYLQNAATPKEPALTYTLAITVKGDRPASVGVQLALPPGFDTVPGTLKIDGATLADPTIDNDNVAALALGTLAPGAHTATLDAYAGLVLGPAVATANGTATAGTTP
jgi:hypothetical protein